MGVNRRAATWIDDITADIMSPRQLSPTISLLTALAHIISSQRRPLTTSLLTALMSAYLFKRFYKELLSVSALVHFS